MVEPRHLLGKTLEILFHWQILTEMEVTFEYVSILIPLSVEIAEDEPFGIETLLRGRGMDGS